MVLPALAGVGGAVASLGSFTQNKFIAFLLLMAFFIADGAVSGIVGFQGVAGFLFSSIFSTLLGVQIFWSSWEVMILVIFLYIIVIFLSFDNG